MSKTNAQKKQNKTKKKQRMQGTKVGGSEILGKGEKKTKKQIM